MRGSHKDELASKEVSCLETIGNVLTEKSSLREQLLQDKLTQMEKENLELQKTAKRIIKAFTELDEAFEALVEEIQILKANFRKHSNSGGHTGTLQSYRDWYGYYGLIEDHRRIMAQNQLQLQ